jgi:hypothetical protein
MTVTQPNPDVAASGPVDAVVERLNDPAVAASLVVLLDNAELVSTLVLGLGEFVARGDMIMDAVADGVNDFKAAGGAGQLAGSKQILSDLLNSAIARPETIALLSDLSEAATEGAANAARNDTKIDGVRSAVKAFRDPDVQRGLGLLVEVARSLGRQMS